MKKSKQWFRSKQLCGLILWAILPTTLWADSSQGGNETITKDLWGASGGVAMTGGNESFSFAAGEAIAGGLLSNTTDMVISGYFGGYFGSGTGLQLLNYIVGTTAFYQDSIQVGVPLNASVRLNFSDLLQAATLPGGITATAIVDHLGQAQNTPVSIQFNYNPSTSTVILTSTSGWLGDTLYDIVITQGLQSIDGFTVSSPVHVQFITALDPGQENVVLHPIGVGAAGFASTSRSASPVASALHLDIPIQALADFSFVLVNTDPLHASRRIDPQIIQDANQKALAASGGYSVPIAIQEVNGFNLQGGILNNLTQEATLSMSYNVSQNLVNGTAAPVRASTLHVWALDETHHLWVKLPESAINAQSGSVSAPIAQFSVFALMGGSDGNAGDSYVFPIPWRPHGPKAGNGPGETGTEQGGLTFSSLPSECTIKIYTISGNLVRELHHSDTQGLIAQQLWDGLTANGQHVASGVYLWRVESTNDGKNGKLMIIR